MTYHTTITTTDAPDQKTLSDDLDAALIDFDKTDDDEPPELRDRLNGGYLSNYRATYHLADTADPTAIRDAIATVVNTLDWATNEIRHDFEEYDDAKREDATYYPTHRTTGLRTPPTLNADGMTATVTAACVISGSAYDITDATVDVAAPTDYARTDLIIGTDTGVDIVEGTAVERGTKPTAPDAPADTVALGTVTVKEPIDHIVSGGLVAEPFESDPATVLEDSWGTMPDPQTLAERVQAVEAGTGTGQPGEKGVASRIDKLETAVEDLKTYH